MKTIQVESYLVRHMRELVVLSRLPEQEENKSKSDGLAMAIISVWRHERCIKKDLKRCVFPCEGREGNEKRQCDVAGKRNCSIIRDRG